MNSTEPVSANEQFKIGLVAMLPRLNRYARNLTPVPWQMQPISCKLAVREFGIDGRSSSPGSDFDRWAFTVMSSINRNHLRAAQTRHGSGIVCR